MTRFTRRAFALVTGALVVAAAVAWTVDHRARPQQVGPRLVAALQARHAGATIRAVGPALLEVALPSGVTVDVRSAALFDRCREARLGCGGLVDDTVAAVGDVEAATRAPRVADLRPALVPDGVGYRYGDVAEPFFGAIESRVALVKGLASTDVTAAIADRLHLTADALRAAALAQSRHDTAPTLVRLTEPATPALYRVVLDGDPATVLLDRTRMTALGQALDARRIDCFVPARGVLYVAPASEAAARALDSLRTRMPGVDGQPLGTGVFAYDIDAADGAQLAMVRGLR